MSAIYSGILNCMMAFALCYKLESLKDPVFWAFIILTPVVINLHSYSDKKWNRE